MAISTVLKFYIHSCYICFFLSIKDTFDVKDPVFNPKRPKIKPKGDRPGLSPAAGYFLVSQAVFENPMRCICQ
jgi:hypothetical protein